MLEAEGNTSSSGSAYSVRFVGANEFRALLLSRRKLERVWTRSGTSERLYEPASRIVYVARGPITAPFETPVP